MTGHKFEGIWKVECFNPDGSLAWEDEIHNGVTNAGINDNLAVYFNSGTQKPTWYGGLIDNASFSALSAGDTISSHSGWIENNNYSESVRQTWTSGAPSGQSITNSASMVFSINATVTIKGAFLVSNSTKGGASGILWSTGTFASGNQSLVNGQQLKLTYTLTGASS